MVLDPSTGQMVTAPEYGGTIRAVVNFKNEGIDPYYRYTAGAWIGLVNEKLGVGDWAIDRSVVGYTTLFLPDEALTGQLAESWEDPDPLTYIFKIRDGVFWHDKAPVNGRQLTAHDVAYSWQRLLFGVDGGESSPDCPGGFDICNIKWESVTATDDSTVVFKLKEPSLVAFSRMLVADHGYIVAREVVQQFGDIQDWRNVTGTGPYQLTDVLEGSSWTYTRIDDYWRPRNCWTRPAIRAARTAFASAPSMSTTSSSTWATTRSPWTTSGRLASTSRSRTFRARK